MWPHDSNAKAYNYQRYLSAKKGIDDRSLNCRVWKEMASLLPRSRESRPLRILEVGAGIGTMLERIIDRRLVSYAEYTAVDFDPENEREFRIRLGARADGMGLHLRGASDATMVLRPKGMTIESNFEICDAYDYLLGEGRGRSWDLLIAQAFLDLVDLPTFLPLFCSCAAPGGLLYLSLNYDGETLFLPPMDLDEEILEIYHRSMDERVVNGRRSGLSKTGRSLFDSLRAVGAEVIAAGGSDWVVFPSGPGYGEEEAYFLHFIIYTIARALEDHPLLPRDRFDLWVKERHAQIDRGTLIYVARQFDFLAALAERR